MRKPSPQVLDLLSDRSPGVIDLALRLREVVLEEAPEAEEVLYSVYAQVIVFKLPERKNGAFCSVVAYTKHVNLQFFFGAKLADPHGLLTGSGKQMRHIRLDSPHDLEPSILRGYIRSAIEFVTESAPKAPRKTKIARKGR